jgi:small subunit ribosomal protein S6
MQHYELLCIVSVSLADDEQKKLIEKVAQLISTEGMSITLNKEMGKRKLAYPIKKEITGLYHVLEFDGEQAGIKKLDREMRLMSGILRFVILKKRVKTQEELDKERRVREKVEGRKREAEQEEIAKEKEMVREAEAKEHQEHIEEKRPESTKKISLEDLDKKLDDILKEEDV